MAGMAVGRYPPSIHNDLVRVGSLYGMIDDVIILVGTYL